MLETAYHFLLLLVGFDTLTYRKDYDRSPILVGHHNATKKQQAWDSATDGNTGAPRIRRNLDESRSENSPQMGGGNAGKECERVKEHCLQSAGHSGEDAPVRRAPPMAANAVDSSASAAAFSSRLLFQSNELRGGLGE